MRTTTAIARATTSPARLRGGSCGGAPGLGTPLTTARSRNYGRLTIRGRTRKRRGNGTHPDAS
eukprot:6537479-Lingulodinium_polyedra.AAC.1